MFALRFLQVGILLYWVAGEAVAQSSDVWLFGSNAGIDHSSGAPTAASSPLVALEGTSSMSDQLGELLFYTNGNTLWDRNDVAMPNGTGLLGGASSTQAALAVPLPGSCGIYYVFTTSDHFQSGDLRYSVVDMCLNNGNGDVPVGYKNILLSPSMSEKLTAVRHANGVDIWIVTYQKGLNGFFAYLLTASGVDLSPVVSNVGPSFGAGDCVIGPMKASHDGSRLVMSSSFCNRCQMVDFDAVTGVVSNPVNLTAALALPGGIYGIEFSPNDELLYLAAFWGTSRLYQVDLSTMTRIVLGEAPGNYTYGALQLASDGRIYMARQGEEYVDVIQDPDVLGVGCDYTTPGFALLPGTESDIGLPNSAPFMVMHDPDLNTLSVDLGFDTLLCSSLPFELTVAPPCNGSVQWQDGSIANTYSVTGPGIYWVQVNSVCGVATDSVVVLGSGVFLGPDTTLCTGSEILLEIGSGWTDVLWSDGSSGDSLLISEPGVYWVNTSGQQCVASDTITVSFIEAPMVDLGPDLVVCESDIPELGTGLVGLPHIWQDGSTGETLIAALSGTYWVEVGVVGCSASDTVIVEVIPLPVVELGPDTTLCSGGELVLEASAGPAAIMWQDGSTTPTLIVGTSGNYWVTLDDQGCLASDTIVIGFIEPPMVDLGPDITACEGEPTTLGTDLPGVPHTWQDGSSGESFIPVSSGVYWVEVGLPGCSASDSVEVVVIPLPVVDLGPDTTLCSGVPYSLSVFAGTGDILWQDGSSVEVYQVDSAGAYWVIIDDQGCIASDTVVVEFMDLPNLDLGPDTVACTGDMIDLVTGLAGVPHTWQDGTTDESYAAGSSGTYWVTVGQVGCLSTDSVLVEFIATPDLELGPDTVLCSGNELLLEVELGPATIVWQDGSSSAVYSITEGGVYWAVVDLLGCTANDTITVLVVDPPLVDLGSDLGLCAGEEVELVTGVLGLPHLWQDGTTAEVMQVAISGTYWVVVGPVGCSGTDTIEVEVTPIPVIALGADTVICAAQELVLTSGYPSQNSTWQDGTQATTFTVTGPGEYGVVVVVQGCTASASITVGVDVLPALILPGDTMLCDASTILLQASATPGVDVTWQDGTVGPSYLAQGPGLFSASIGNACGTVSDSVLISVAAPFLVPDRYLVCFGDLVRIDWSDHVVSVTWNNGSSEVDLLLPEGGYSFTALDMSGCPREGELLVYSDIEADGMSYVPNVFTPNGDGLNEQFTVVGADRDGFIMEIFNRWGALIFESNDTTQGWDGRHNGMDVPDGTYVYIISYNSRCGTQGRVTKVGHVTVLR